MLAAAHVGEPTRDGRVVEARGEDGGPPYVVEWSDGHTGLIYPGPGAVLRITEHDGHEGKGGHDGHGDRGAAPPTQEAQPAAQAHATSTSPASTRTAPGAALPHVREWTVRVSIFEDADDTDVRAVLVADAPEHLVATGRSHRSPRDTPVPEIGDEVAVARALRHLADHLLAAAEQDIEDMTGKDAYVRPT